MLLEILSDCSTIIFRVSLLGLSHPEDTDTTVLLKVWNCSPSDRASHHRRLVSSCYCDSVIACIILKDDWLLCCKSCQYFYITGLQLCGCTSQTCFEHLFVPLGRKIAANCEKAPFTCQLISEFPAARDCRRGQVKFSVMHAGTHVWPHCGPTNCRLRSHLGLIVPQGTYIRVAEETR